MAQCDAKISTCSIHVEGQIINQQIQILDGYEYNCDVQGIKIVAMCSGLLIDCVITGISQNNALAYYQQNQFDIEEYLIEQIENEAWDESGAIKVAHSVIR